MKNMFTLIFAVALLVSCNAQPLNAAVPTAIRTVSITATANLVSPTGTATSTPQPTITQYPTFTKEPTETINPLIATREAALDSCRGDSKDRIDKYVFQAYSTNGQWSATVCQDNGIYTKVSNLNKDIVWKIPAIDTDETIPGPEWFLEPYLWSTDGHYLYLTPEVLGFIDSPWLIYSSGYGLFRLNLSTGQVDTWLKPGNGGIWYSFAFTEDGKLFAFSPEEIPGTIKIRNLTSGNEQTLSFKDQYSILEYRWTPDGSRLVIFTEERVADRSQSGFSIFVYSVKSEVLKKVVDKNSLNSSFSAEEFAEPRIYISGLSNEVLSLSDVFQENNFELNIRTGKLVQVNELGTPVPPSQ